MKQAEVGQSPTLLALRFATGVYSIPQVYFAASTLSPGPKKVYPRVYPTQKKREALRIIPPHMEAVLFNWGLSSKAPKPPLERLRAGCKPHGQPTTQAYIQPENGSLFKLARCTFVSQMKSCPLLRSRRELLKRLLQASRMF